MMVNTLVVLCLQFVGENVELFSLEDLKEVPVQILESLKWFLSAAQLFRLEDLFKNLGICTKKVWSNQYLERWPHKFQQMPRVFGSDDSELHSPRHNYLEKHFHEVLRRINFDHPETDFLSDPNLHFHKFHYSWNGKAGCEKVVSDFDRSHLYKFASYVQRLNISSRQCKFVLEDPTLLLILVDHVTRLDIHHISDATFRSVFQLIAVLQRCGKLDGVVLFHGNLSECNMRKLLLLCAGIALPRDLDPDFPSAQRQQFSPYYETKHGVHSVQGLKNGSCPSSAVCTCDGSRPSLATEFSTSPCHRVDEYMDSEVEKIGTASTREVGSRDTRWSATQNSHDVQSEKLSEDCYSDKENLMVNNSFDINSSSNSPTQLLATSGLTTESFPSVGPSSDSITQNGTLDKIEAVCNCETKQSDTENKNMKLFKSGGDVVQETTGQLNEVHDELLPISKSSLPCTSNLYYLPPNIFSWSHNFFITDEEPGNDVDCELPSLNAQNTAESSPLDLFDEALLSNDNSEAVHILPQNPKQSSFTNRSENYSGSQIDCRNFPNINSEHSGLKKIGLFSCNAPLMMTEILTEALVEWKSLERFTAISYGVLNDDLCRALTRLVCHGNLTDVVLESETWGKSPVLILYEMLLKNRSEPVECLMLNGACAVSDATSLPSLPEITMPFRGVVYLDLSRATIPENEASLLIDIIRHNRSLRHLFLDQCSFVASRLKILLSCLHGTSLETLSLRENVLTDHLSLVHALPDVPSLRKLNLDHSGLPPELVRTEEFYRILNHHPNLHDISLSGNRLCDAACVLLEGLCLDNPSSTKQWILDIGYNYISADSLIATMQVIKDGRESRGPVFRKLTLSGSLFENDERKLRVVHQVCSSLSQEVVCEYKTLNTRPMAEYIAQM